MPQSLYPPVLRIDDNPALQVEDKQTGYNLERLHELAERLNKQLEQVTGLELEKGDL